MATVLCSTRFNPCSGACSARTLDVPVATGVRAEGVGGVGEKAPSRRSGASMTASLSRKRDTCCLLEMPLVTETAPCSDARCSRLLHVAVSPPVVIATWLPPNEYLTADGDASFAHVALSSAGTCNVIAQLGFDHSAAMQAVIRDVMRVMMAEPHASAHGVSGNLSAKAMYV